MDVRQQVRQFIRNSFLVDDFADDDSFLASGIVDSLGIMQLVTFIEREFAVHVQDADLVPDNFDSVAKVSGFIERRRAAA